MTNPETESGRPAWDARYAEEPVRQALQLAEELRRMHQAGVFGGLTACPSPEQLRGEPIDARSDIFAFGAAAYELFSGRKAFRSTDPEELNREVLEQSPEPLADAPPQIVRLVDRCLKKKPADRWQRVPSLVIELKLALAAVRQARSAAEWKERLATIRAEVATQDERIIAQKTAQQRVEGELRESIQALDQKLNGHDADFATIHETLTAMQESLAFLRKNAEAQSKTLEGLESAASQTDEVVEHIVEAFGLMHHTMVERGEAKVLLASGNES